MIAIRIKSSSTTANAQHLVDFIKDPNCVRVTLAASPKAAEAGANYSGDGPDTNYPLLAACAVYEIPHVGPVCVIMDGLFLTTQRHPRYSEVKFALDEAQNSNKVFFHNDRVPFTSGLTADAAAEVLSDGDTRRLSESTRANYFSLLSNVKEEYFAK